MTALSFVFAFVLMLGVLIAVHEFGHFLAAKLCGVRVLKFSLGFGPPVGVGRFRMRWERGGTEYVVAWFPLGGFVKMLGENPGDEDSPDAVAHHDETLGSKATWQKLIIVFAGPVMNLLLPVVIFAGSLYVGMDRADAIVGTVERGSPAEAQGLQPGDRILRVDGQPMDFWTDVEDAVRARPGESLRLEVERSGSDFEVDLDVIERPGLDIFRLVSDVGWVGLRYARQKAVLGVPDARRPAAAAGLHTGDLVRGVDGVEVEDWNGLARAYAAHEGAGPVLLKIERGEEEAAETLTIPVPALPDLDSLGIIPASVLVSQVSADQPAEEAGIEPGDLILTVDDRPIGSFASFAETIRASGGRPLALTFGRNGQTRHTELSARLRKLESDAGMEEEVYLIGIVAEDVTLRGGVVRDQVRNPLVAIPRAIGMTLETTRLFLRGLSKLATGEISRSNIGGPIEIARQSHLALQAGWDSYLRLLVLISINLGILNLLPIPILDGGQALIFLVEGVKREPLSLRTREFVQSVGLVMLVTIMGFAFWNDVSRHWERLLEWVRSSAGL
jgi:regulator of sigma E protease